MFHKLFLKFRMRKNRKEQIEKKTESLTVSPKKEGTFHDLWDEKQYILSYLFLYEIIEREEKDCLWQDVLIVDGEDSNLVTMVEGFVTRAKYLTIITKHPEWYVGVCDRIYRECGMIMELKLVPRDELTRAGARIYMEKNGQRKMIWSSHFPCPQCTEEMC